MLAQLELPQKLQKLPMINILTVMECFPGVLLHMNAQQVRHGGVADGKLSLAIVKFGVRYGMVPWNLTRCLVVEDSVGFL